MSCLPCRRWLMASALTALTLSTIAPSQARRKGRRGRSVRAVKTTAPAVATSPAASPAARRASARKAAERIAKLMERLPPDPGIMAVQRAAVRLARAQPQRARRWLRRCRKAAWLPSLQMGAGGARRKDGSLAREAGTADQLRRGAMDQISYEIKLSWDLPRLIFDPNELKVLRESQRLSELREQVLTQVTRLYFERRRQQLLALLRPAATVRAALRVRLRLAELTAVLDALTGGLFARTRRPRQVTQD